MSEKITHRDELSQLIRSHVLTEQQIESLINGAVNQNTSSEQFASILSILAYRGETATEISWFAKSFRQHMRIVSGANSYIDMCGTGGDGHDTFNISTTCMFVVAGAGVPVAKHGNRASSSKSGSADVLEILGANLEYDVQSAIDNGEPLVFMFAPNFHPAMKAVAPVRRSLGVPTVFNMLGPLLNPANTRCQMIGTTSQKKAELIANAVALLSHERVGVIYNEDGLDELTTTCKNSVFEVRGGKVTISTIDPHDFGLPYAAIEDLRGGDTQENATILRAVLDGQEGSLSDIVLLNSAYALYISGKTGTVQDGIKVARESISSGKATQALNKFVDSTTRYRGVS